MSTDEETKRFEKTAEAAAEKPAQEEKPPAPLRQVVSAKNPPELLYGNVAVSIGVATEEMVAEALKHQEEAKAKGEPHRRLGEILRDLHLINWEEGKDILTAQGIRGGHRQIEGYKMVSILGEGAMGSVYKAIQVSMQRYVALKTLSPRLAKDLAFVRRFLNEARATARLNHENIIAGYDAGESNGINYFAMEYVNGPTVQKLLDRGGALDEDLAVDITRQVARAAEHWHRNKMIHRDIKPANIMLTREKTAKVCDLGLAITQKYATGAAAGRDTRSLGTPNYISPEQAKGEQDIDIRSDIYSLGAAFYHMIAGHVPFEGRDGREVAKNHILKPLVPPRMRNPEISDGASDIVEYMMVKDKDARCQTPGEVLEMLEALVMHRRSGPAYLRGKADKLPNLSRKPVVIDGKLMRKVVVRKRRIAPEEYHE